MRIKYRGKGLEMIMQEERHIKSPSDLRRGERKVVVYSNGRRTIVVPDDTWDGIGDLSGLPQADRDAITHPSRYKINRRGTVIDPIGNNDLGVPGRRILDDLDEKGFAELPGVEVSEERVEKLGEK